MKKKNPACMGLKKSRLQFRTQWQLRSRRVPPTGRQVTGRPSPTGLQALLPPLRDLDLPFLAASSCMPAASSQTSSTLSFVPNAVYVHTHAWAQIDPSTTPTTKRRRPLFDRCFVSDYNILVGFLHYFLQLTIELFLILNLKAYSTIGKVCGSC
jgi:hypothetical protein